MLANLLSISRIFLGVSFIFIANNKYLAFTILLIAGITDILDGYLAKKYKKTKYGNAIDQIVDRIFTFTVIITLIIYYRLNIWYALLMLTRIFTKGAALFTSFILKKKIQIPESNIIGKLANLFLFIALFSIILNLYNNIFVFIAIVVSIFTAIYYILFNT